MSAALSLLLLLQASEPPEPPAIIIQARRAEDDLAACLARACPPAEEVEASLDAAVQQFADGRYVDAKGNLGRAVSRNRRHAAEMPELFASLLATYATVAEHEGDNEVFRRATFERGRLLREHLGETSLETIVADLESGDMQATSGNAAGAEGSYRRAQAAAEQSGRQRVAAAAAFRRAWLALAGRSFGRAERLAAEAAVLAGPGDAGINELVNILQIRIAFAKGDDAAVEQRLSALQAVPRQLPLLVAAPRLPELGPPPGGTRLEVGSIRFIDLGFWIRPDGRTAEAEVLRSDGDTTWFNPMLEQVAERRYAPAVAEPGDPGTYQIERYTLRPSYGTPTGTRLVQRIGRYTLHVANLTHMSEEQAQAAASPLR